MDSHLRPGPRARPIPVRHWVRQSRSNWFWGLLLPVAAAGAAWPSHGLSLLLLLGYPVLARGRFSVWSLSRLVADQSLAVRRRTVSWGNSR